MVSWSNPMGGTTNSDLEMAGSVLHHDGFANCFGMQECIVLSRTYNMATMWWQSKGSATSTSALPHLLQTQSLHQQFHRYVPRHDFVRGVGNGISDLPSRSAHLTDAELLHHFNAHSPQPLPWRMWTPYSKSVSCEISALRRRPLLGVFLVQEPPPPIPTGRCVLSSAPTWPSTPFSCCTGTPSLSSPTLSPSTAMATSAPVVRTFAPARWRMPSAPLTRRLLQWGSRNRG